MTVNVTPFISIYYTYFILLSNIFLSTEFLVLFHLGLPVNEKRQVHTIQQTKFYFIGFIKHVFR